MPSAEEYLAKMEDLLAEEQELFDCWGNAPGDPRMQRKRELAAIYSNAAMAAASLPRFEIEVAQSAHTEGEQPRFNPSFLAGGTGDYMALAQRGERDAEKAAADPDVLQPDDDIGDS